MSRRVLRAMFRRLGKGSRKVAAVFGCAPGEIHAAVVHLRRGAPGIPVWLFATVQPLQQTAELCERTYVNRRPAGLVVDAIRALWSEWTAIAVTTWSGGHVRRPVRLAPFLISPLRVLILNRDGGFFAATPGNVCLHLRRALAGAVCSGWNRIQDVSRGLWLLAAGCLLLLAASLLRLCGYPDRRLFRRLHGHEPLRALPSGSAGAGLVRFRQDPVRWHAAELEQLALSTEARWILFHPDGEDRGVQDMLPLFDEPDTFAVSRQGHYRECRTSLFAMAPFRRLQPCEASQVLAPLSGEILVDRRKLAALGIPKAGLAWTAWLLLFWKAAAAGWRSYSVGGGSGVGRQPDLPLQERAFIFRALSDPALRRLGPAEPELSRGNIAFAPALLRAASWDDRRLKVLLVSPFLPWPLSHGGAVRIHNLCRALAGRVDFILLAMREAGESADYGRLHELFREVYVVDRDELPASDPPLPRQVREHQSGSLAALIGSLAQRRRPDVLQIEYTHMAHFRAAAPQTPALLVEHDLTFLLYRRLAESRPSERARREYQRWLRFEQRWLAVYDGVWTVSDDDRETASIEANRPPERTFTIPNGVDTRWFVPAPREAEQPEVLFVGSFRHLPNILAVEKLLLEVMPAVWRRLPDAHLRVVAGPQPERFCRVLGGKPDLLRPDPRVTVHGYVEDLRPLYARASVVAAPLEVSAGTNIKVLEAMSSGKAIVTTPAGCSGLGLRDGTEAVIAADWPACAEAICALLQDPALRGHLGRHARCTAIRRFGWEAIAERAYRSYLAVAASPGPPFTRLDLTPHGALNQF